MDRSQKADAVAQLNAVFNEVSVVVVTRNLGMTVAQTTALRGKMREAGARDIVLIAGKGHEQGQIFGSGDTMRIEPFDDVEVARQCAGWKA